MHSVATQLQLAKASKPMQIRLRGRKIIFSLQLPHMSIPSWPGMQAVRHNRYVILPKDFEAGWKDHVARSNPVSWSGWLGTSWFRGDETHASFQCFHHRLSPYLLAPGSCLNGLQQQKAMRRRRKTGTLISTDSEQRCHQIHFRFCMQQIMTSSDKQSLSATQSSWKADCHYHAIFMPSIINS